MSALEQKWGRCIQASPRVLRYLGVDARSMDARKASFWTDLVAICKEYWSTSIKMGMEKPGHVSFDAQGPFGSTIGVLITGLDADPLGVLLDIKKGYETETLRKNFPPTTSLQDLIWWIDSKAVTTARSWL